MNREQVVTWLNKRLKDTQKKQMFHFDNEDLNFIREYIWKYKNKSVSLQEIAESISAPLNGSHVVYSIDCMITILINDMNIQTETKSRMINDPQYNISEGLDPFARVSIDFITKYF